MIWVLLEVLQVIKTSHLFHHDRELILTVLIKEVLLSACQHILKTFKSNRQHPDIIDLKHGSQSLNHAFRHKIVKLQWIGTSCTVTKSPNCLIFNLNIIMLQNLNKLVHNANIYTDLDLFFSSSRNI